MGKYEIFKQREMHDLAFRYPPIKESRMSKSINYFGQLFVIAISVPLGFTLLVVAYKCLRFVMKLKLE